MSPPDQSPAERVVFSYLVPVHVEVENGAVCSVTVIDETPIRDPVLIEGEPADFSGAVREADASQTWPAWRFGY